MISLSNEKSNLILAAPSQQNGEVLLVYFNRSTERKIKAHQSSIFLFDIVLSALELTGDGEKLATTS